MLYILWIKIIFQSYLNVIVIWAQSLFEREYVLLRKKQIYKLDLRKSRCRLDVKPICLILHVLIRNQFLAHACCRCVFSTMQIS